MELNQIITKIEEDLVEPMPPRGTQKVFAIPATRIAEEVGKKIVLNIVMMGFIAAVGDVSKVEAIRESVKSNVPASTIEMNMAAFDSGYEFGVKLLEKSK